jgi:DNA-binding transcriptional LysR family regulator
VKRKLVPDRRLEYLLALSREAHFARAAASCHVSQPTLSAAIQQLEADLSVQIVKRGTRFRGFTEEGEIVLAGARRLAVEWDHVQQRLRDRNKDLSGTLRIGVLGSTIPLLRIFTVPFREQYPNANLSVMIQSPFDIHQGIEESSLDVAITYSDEKLCRHSHTHPLYVEEYEVLIRKDTQFSQRQSLSWEELKELPLCILSPDMTIFGSRESKILSETLSQTSHIITNAIWLVMDHVRTGKWASVLPRPVKMMIARDDELVTIPLPHTGKPLSVVVAIPRREPVSPLAKAFFQVATSDDAVTKLHALLQTVGAEPTDSKTSSKRSTETVSLASKGKKRAPLGRNPPPGGSGAGRR